MKLILFGLRLSFRYMSWFREYEIGWKCISLRAC